MTTKTLQTCMQVFRDKLFISFSRTAEVLFCTLVLNDIL